MTAPKLSDLNVAIVGDVSTGRDLARIADRLAVIHGTDVDESIWPDAIEIVTDIDLGPGLDDFEVMDEVVSFARTRGLYLFLRVVPRVSGDFERSRFFNTVPGSGESYMESDLPSLFDKRYQRAARDYFSAVATRYREDPTVIGYGLAVGPSGEAQYKIQGTYVTDCSDTAFADYRAWMAGFGIDVDGFPAMPTAVTPETRVSFDDPDYYLWAYWRVKRLNELLSEVAADVKAIVPHAYLYVFSYMEIAAPAGYGPGFVDADPNIDWFFGNISLDHGFFCPRNEDRSRPETLAQTSKVVAGEFDLISAYTDAIHAEAFVRYFYLMGMQPRTFVPIWWDESKTGGWAEGFWTKYSDELAREMARLVKANHHLRETESVADTVIIVPNISALGVMAADMPWQSDEFKASHSDIARHLAAIGSNFELITEDTVTSEKLDRYKLVIVISPALYPWVRSALQCTTADVLAIGWAGTICPPGPHDVRHAHSWFNRTPSFWPTGGSVVKRAPRISFPPNAANPLFLEAEYGQGDTEIVYVRHLSGTVLAVDDEFQAVFTTIDWGDRRLYHFGLPLMGPDHNTQILPETRFRSMLARILAQSGCTAYEDLGPLRLFETSRFLLAENPKGTSGTLDAPAGDFGGVIPCKLKHRPDSRWLTADGKIALGIPAGRSVVVPLSAGGLG